MSIIPQNVRGDKGEGGAKAVFFMNFLEEKGEGDIFPFGKCDAGLRPDDIALCAVIYSPSGNMKVSLRDD